MAGRKKMKSEQPSHAKAEVMEPETQPKRGDESKPRRGLAIISAAGAIALFFAVYLLRLDRVVGMTVDDSWYVMLAKALATGQGYTLINSPSPGILPLYPPAFSFVLSLVFRLAPEFPQNLWLLKMVSILAMLGVGIVTYRYFVRERELPPSLAFGIAVATTLSPGLVFMATSTVMSECFFTLAQLLTIVSLERSVRVGQSRAAWRYAALGGVFAAVAFLTRSMGAGLLVAGLIYLLKTRLARPAIIFAASLALLIGPWMIYARQHAPTEAQRREQRGNIVKPYTEQFWQRLAGADSSGRVSASELPERFWNNTVEIFGLDIGAIVASPFFRPASHSGQEVIGLKGQAVATLALIGLLAVIGFISVARERLTLSEIVVPISMLITIVWPWWTFRFILPLLPWIIFYILMGLRTVYRLSLRLGDRAENPRAQWLTLTVIVWCVIVVSLYDHAKYIYAKTQLPLAERPAWICAFDEHETMLNWIREKLPKEVVIAAQNPALVYLYTGQKTVAPDDMVDGWDSKLRGLGVRYLVRSGVTPVPDPGPAEGQYAIVYRSREKLKLRVTDLTQKNERLLFNNGIANASSMKVGSNQ